MSHASALVDEIANELDTWPGVSIELQAAGVALVRYERLPLGTLDRERGVAVLHVSHPEHEELVEHGDAEPADPRPESDDVSHAVEGPSDVTAVLALFDERYRDLRGEDDPYSSEDPD
ncbi:MAG TPA: luciferase family protein [Thermoleophilaceae bacterium]